MQDQLAMQEYVTSAVLLAEAVLWVTARTEGPYAHKRSHGIVQLVGGGVLLAYALNGFLTNFPAPEAADYLIPMVIGAAFFGFGWSTLPRYPRPYFDMEPPKSRDRI